jgi:CBS domain containing-hemolysin-like protein
MTLIITFYIVIILGCVVFSGFFSGSETAAISVNRLKIRNMQTGGDRRAKEILALLSDTQHVLAVTLVGTNVCTVFGSLVARNLFHQLLVYKGWEDQLARYMPPDELLALLVMTPIFLIFSEILPKQIFRTRADSLMLVIFKPLIALSALLRPMVGALTQIAYLLLLPFGIRKTPVRDRLTREELKSLVGEGIQIKQDETSQRQMIQSIFDLEKTLVREVMKPLVDVVAVRLGATTIDGALDLARRTGYTRLPVFKDRIVNMIGFIDIYDLLAATNSGQVLDAFVKPAYYVPEMTRIDDLLQEFLRQRIQVAIVIDEYGGCSGWVTREDLFEEIVGEIEDEFDKETRTIISEADGSFRVEARLDIDDLNEALHLNLPKKNCETIGGIVYSSLGRVPKVGEKVYHNNIVIEVTEMDRHKITQVNIKKFNHRISPPHGI